ncbi:hypothetical protein [Methanohalophilus portucalensis]|nr:hypothetical protein [Methanohalophilus portucalensis]SMH43184.1 hypothetical protein SAMN06264941_1917 [Methanohalophilus portucalensis FDF-1]
MVKIAHESGLSTGEGKYNKLRTHNLRSFFIKTLHSYGYGIQDVHFLAGKSTGESYETYLTNYGTPEEAVTVLKDKYVDYMNHLMFTEKVNINLIKDRERRLEKKIAEMEIEHNKEIKMMRMESEVNNEQVKIDAITYPYQKEIEDKEYWIKEYNKYLTYGMKPIEKLTLIGTDKNKIKTTIIDGKEYVNLTTKDIDSYKRTIKILKKEKGRFEYEIERIKEPYLEKIEEIKKKYDIGE